MPRTNKLKNDGSHYFVSFLHFLTNLVLQICFGHLNCRPRASTLSQQRHNLNKKDNDTSP